MNELKVRNVDVLGDTIVAAQDCNGEIWAGVNYFCKALGMTKNQRDAQVSKVQSDKVLSKGCEKFPAGTFDQSNEAVVIQIDFLPLWLAKISVTPRMEKETPELAKKLLNYQLQAKDILAAAFLPKQDATPLTIQQQIQTIAKGTAELYEKVAAIDAKAESVKDELEAFKQELPLFPEDADEVRAALNKKVVDYLGGDSNAYHDRGLRQKAFIDAYRELKRNFGVSTYKSIKRNQKKRALEVIEAYKPPVILLDEIQMVNSQISLDLEGGASRC